MACDMCGSSGRIVKAQVEGVIMDVCNNCAKYGNIVRKPRPLPQKSQKRAMQSRRPQQSNVMERIVGDYASIIKKAREKLQYSQEQFAKMLNEKESLMQRIEAGKQRPNMGLSRKLERTLKIKLIEKMKVEDEETTQKASRGPLTIGDMIKIKK